MKHLDASPLSTKAFTSVIAATLGDSLAQHISKPEEDPDWRYVLTYLPWSAIS